MGSIRRRYDELLDSYLRVMAPNAIEGLVHELGLRSFGRVEDRYFMDDPTYLLMSKGKLVFSYDISPDGLYVRDTEGVDAFTGRLESIRSGHPLYLSLLEIYSAFNEDVLGPESKMSERVHPMTEIVPNPVDSVLGYSFGEGEGVGSVMEPETVGGRVYLRFTEPKDISREISLSRSRD